MVHRRETKTKNDFTMRHTKWISHYIKIWLFKYHLYLSMSCLNELDRILRTVAVINYLHWHLVGYTLRIQNYASPIVCLHLWGESGRMSCVACEREKKLTNLMVLLFVVPNSLQSTEILKENLVIVADVFLFPRKKKIWICIFRSRSWILF